jgi:hypothetical protein
MKAQTSKIRLLNLLCHCYTISSSHMDGSQYPLSPRIGLLALACALNPEDFIFR